MSHQQPGLVDLRTLAEHPMVEAGPADGAWQPNRPGDLASCTSAGCTVCVTTAASPRPPHPVRAGIARENFAAEVMELSRSGRELTAEERTAFSPATTR